MHTFSRAKMYIVLTGLVYLAFSSLYAVLPAYAAKSTTGALVSATAPAPQDGCGRLTQQFSAFGAGDLLGLFPKHCTAEGLLLTIIRLGFAMVGIVTVIFLMIGGFRYMTAAGSTERATQGKRTVIWAVIGLAIVISAITIVTLVSNFIVGNSSGGTATTSNVPPDDDGSNASSTTRTQVDSKEAIAQKIEYTVTSKGKYVNENGNQFYKITSLEIPVSAELNELDALCPGKNYFAELSLDGTPKAEQPFEKYGDTSYRAIIKYTLAADDADAKEVVVTVCGYSIKGNPQSVR